MAVNICVGQQMRFQVSGIASALPAALNQVSYTSSSPSVAIVIADSFGHGVLYALTAGSTTITATHTWTDATTITGAVVVTVVAAAKPTSLTLATEPLETREGWTP